MDNLNNVLQNGINFMGALIFFKIIYSQKVCHFCHVKSCTKFKGKILIFIHQRFLDFFCGKRTTTIAVSNVFKTTGEMFLLCSFFS